MLSVLFANLLFAQHTTTDELGDGGGVNQKYGSWINSRTMVERALRGWRCGVGWDDANNWNQTTTATTTITTRTTTPLPEVATICWLWRRQRTKECWVFWNRLHVFPYVWEHTCTNQPRYDCNERTLISCDCKRIILIVNYHAHSQTWIGHSAKRSLCLIQQCSARHH